MQLQRRLIIVLLLMSLICLPLAAQQFASAEEAELAALLAPAIRLEQHMMSLDYFGQFTRGDTIFEDYLYEIFRMDQGRYIPGQGSRLEVQYGGQDLLIIDQVLLPGAQEDTRTWMIQISGGSYDIYYEVDVLAPGIPLRIRYRNPETGLYSERSTMIGEELVRVIDDLGMETIAAKVIEERDEDLRDALRSGYAGARVVERRMVDSTVGEVKASVVRNMFEGGGEVLYTFSDGVPGGIVTITAPRPEGDREVARLIEVTEGNRSHVGREELVPEDEIPTGPDNVSQGSIEDPLRLELGDYISGSVAEGGVSYYSFEVPFATDLVVEVSDFAGYAELFDYGTDETYWFWQTSSSGELMTLEYYNAEPGTIFYFTVEDIIDEYSSGESYYIGVRED